jgi:uncharacterized protein (TIGR02145 family)
MKNIIPILFLILSLPSYSQSPQGIPYQAVMRNADGSVMASSAVNMTFMIHDGTANGTMVYQESHSLTSNAQGLVSCVVGNGTVVQGNFANINWGSGAKFLQVMMGTTDLGTQQMLSVPYALFGGSTNVSVSSTGDTLTVGGHSVIVPGISAANPPSLYTQGTGVTDIDGNTYTSIIINGQEWMQQNLTVTKYRNGDPIPTGLSNTTWENTTSGAYAIYNNDAANNTLYGKLYNWHAVNDSRGLCPTGWHVPSDAEWSSFINYIDPSADGGNNMNVAGGKMKATTDWDSPNTGATNESGFTGLPGGYLVSFGTYEGIGTNGFWWSSTEVDSVYGLNGYWWSSTDYAWIRGMSYVNSLVNRYFDTNKQFGFSVRCVKDSETPSSQGCTDGAACNFMANATQNDGSCLYQNATCDDGNANTINDVINGSCVCAGTLIVSGCTNPQACNYNAAANVDNGSCLIQGATCDDGNANTTNDVINGSCACVGTQILNGCTNPQACNYNALANVDNGTCLIQGAACNDNNANTTNDVINSSCVCVGTAVGNGIYTPGNGVTDIDGNTYTSIIINGQEWMQQNLAVTKYRNGDPIATGLDNTTWSTTASGAYAIYNNDAANNTLYGKLYNWDAVNDSRGLCPTGWHVPSNAEWSSFINYFDPNANGISPNLAGGKMKATTGWTSPNTGATNESGFTGLPGGARNYGGAYNFIGGYGYWWSSTEYTSSYAWYCGMAFNNTTVGRANGGIKSYGHSVRCVRD